MKRTLQGRFYPLMVESLYFSAIDSHFLFDFARAIGEGWNSDKNPSHDYVGRTVCHYELKTCYKKSGSRDFPSRSSSCFPVTRERKERYWTRAERFSNVQIDEGGFFFA